MKAIETNNNIKSFWFYACATLTNFVCSYAILYVLTNYLSKTHYADYGLYNSIFSLCLIVFNFGIKESVFKLASKREFSELKNTLNWFVNWQCIVFTAILILCWWDYTLAVVAMTFVVLSWLFVAAAYFRGISNYLKDAFCLPVQRLLWLLSLVAMLFLLPSISFVHIFVASFIATLFTLLMMVRGERYMYQFKSRFKPPTLVYKFFLIEAAILTYTRVDVPLLKGVGIESYAIAEYYISVQIFDAAVLVLTPISYFFFNSIAEKLKLQMSGQYSLMIKYSACLLSLVIIGQISWHFLGDLFLACFASQYLESGENISLFIWALYPLVVNLILSSYLILRDAETSYGIACSVGLLCYLLVAWVLIPDFGTRGAIYSRLIVESLLTIFLAALIFIKREDACQ